MKYLLILGDGMADSPVEELGNLTPLQYASTPWFDFMALNGRSGSLLTIPEGYPAGSEVGNLSVLGYDVNECFEGRGPLEAASLGIDLDPDDLALRCNIITVDEKQQILNHHGSHLTTDDGRQLIEYLDKHLGDERVRFIAGLQYKHLLVIKGGNKNVECYPPHDNIGANVSSLKIAPLSDKTTHYWSNKHTLLTADETAEILNQLIEKSSSLLSSHLINILRREKGISEANLIWPWSPGYKPLMKPLNESFEAIKSGVMITAVDLLRGIGRYAGLENVTVDGATGLWNTNYEGKAKAALDALKTHDFVFLHVEATDEASHDRNLKLKLQTIEYLDQRIVGPVIRYIEQWDEPVRIVLLADHPTSVTTGKHTAGAVPFTIYEKGEHPDKITAYSEVDCANGKFGTLSYEEFFPLFIKNN